MLQGTIGAYFRYCSLNYSYALPLLKREIERLHREMVRCCGRMYRTVSYYPATVIANYPPWELDTYHSAAIQCWRKCVSWDSRFEVNFFPDIHATRRDCEKDIERTLLDIWQDRYRSYGKGLWTQSLIPEVGHEIPEVDLHLAQALSGHGCFHKYLFRLKKVPSPLCDCREVKTAEHVFVTTRFSL